MVLDRSGGLGSLQEGYRGDLDDLDKSESWEVVGIYLILTTDCFPWTPSFTQLISPKVLMTKATFLLSSTPSKYDNKLFRFLFVRSIVKTSWPTISYILSYFGRIPGEVCSIELWRSPFGFRLLGFSFSWDQGISVSLSQPVLDCCSS